MNIELYNSYLLLNVIWFIEHNFQEVISIIYSIYVFIISLYKCFWWWCFCCAGGVFVVLVVLLWLRAMKGKMCQWRGRCAHEGDNVPMKGKIRSWRARSYIIIIVVVIVVIVVAITITITIVTVIGIINVIILVLIILLSSGEVLWSYFCVFVVVFLLCFCGGFCVVVVVFVFMVLYFWRSGGVFDVLVLLGGVFDWVVLFFVVLVLRW